VWLAADETCTVESFTTFGHLEGYPHDAPIITAQGHLSVTCLDERMTVGYLDARLCYRALAFLNFPDIP
jgi:hypothetical protein